MAVLSDAGLRWDDGSGRITVIRSKTDAEAICGVVAITSAAMGALDAIRPAGVGGGEKVFGLSESQIARRVKAIAKAAGLADWEFFSGHSGRVGMARRMVQVVRHAVILEFDVPSYRADAAQQRGQSEEVNLQN